MKGFLHVCGMFLLSCFANEAAMAQGVLDPYDVSTPVKDKAQNVDLMSNATSGAQTEEDRAFDPEKMGYVRTEENGNVIFVKKTDRLTFKYQPK